MPWLLGYLSWLKLTPFVLYSAYVVSGASQFTSLYLFVIYRVSDKFSYSLDMPFVYQYLLMYIYVLDFCLSINLRNEYDKNLKILKVVELSGITTKIVILRRY